MSILASQNSEAGPSTLRTLPSTPPTSKTKRRSWFGFTPPNIASSSGASPQQTRIKSRKGSLVDVPPVELELEVTSGQKAGTSRVEDDVGEAEELTIDGQVEKGVRKKKRGSVDSGGEVLRMADLGSVRRTSNGDEERLAHDPGGGSVESTDFTPRIRTFSRTASDRDTYRRSTLPPAQRPVSSLPPRKSSMNRNPSPTIPITFSNKSQPPTPINLDRPLPPLPNLESTPPELPKSIVVTPSSPHRDTFPSESSSSIHTLTAGYTGAINARSQSETRSRDSSKSRRASSGRNSPIGLGLPRTLLGEPGDDDSPPPVPAKPHAVSSPFPSRSTSPAPRITVAGADGHDYDPNKGVDGKKKTRIKRARSLSGILRTGSPVGDTGKVISAPGTPETGEDEETTVKAPGVLGWLGVKRTIRRRASEGKLEASEALEEKSLPPEEAVVPSRSSIFDKERESFGLDEELAETIRRPSRPDYRSSSSNTTVMPTPGKLSTIFNRRTSSPKGMMRSAEPSPHTRPTDPQNIPGIPTQHSTLTATSSQSSLVLPPIEVSSPIYLSHGTWASSPTTEAEEMLFSPGASANWGTGIRPWMDGSIRSSGSSVLGSLPEQGVLESNMPLKPPASNRDGRVRSWSDAPLPPSRITTSASHPHIPQIDESKSVQPSPAETRPVLNARSNSGGNSAILGKMKSVFGKSGNRSRGNTLLQPASNDVDEFGMVRQSGDGSVRMRTSMSSSSDAPSPIAPPSVFLGAQGDRSVVLNETPERSPRTSYTASVSSLQTTSTRQDRTGRPRASTVSLAPTYNPLVPPSPNLLPSSATPPRRRPGTMRRISNGLFGSGPSSPRTTSLFPLPTRSSGSISSGVTGVFGAPDDVPSAGTSPRPSAGSISAVVGGNSIKQISQRDGEESSDVWLERIVANVGRSEISNALAASPDEFHADALKMYMTRFDFTHAPLDVALRMLLMHMSLPRETQQIDRIIEAFAVRYEECEPGLFIQKDNTYVLAFSMMMLHTDAFNRHNKNKMTKADYVRNTRMEGVPPLVLEAFYDNITFTPFVFIEDDSDLYPDLPAEPTPLSGTTPTATFTIPITPAKSGRIDVYHMIVRNSLSGLRVDVEGVIPALSPFSCLGSRADVDLDRLHRCFIMANILEISGEGGEGKRKNTNGLLSGATAKGSESGTDLKLKVTKVGLLSRKDDAADTSKKSGRKWKSWSVILTGSQLLFFKDPTWALTLLDQVPSASVEEGSGRLLLPRMTTFKPDEVFPVQNCVAVYDRDFTSYPHTFRFIMPPARQYLMQAADEAEMNEWISLINYASTFKTAGIRMRGSSMGKNAAVLAGAAAAASHKREVQSSETRRSASPVARKPIFGDASARSSLEGRETRKSDESGSKGVVDVDGANEVVLDPGERLEEVFDEVKAELAAGRGGAAPLSNKVNWRAVKEVKGRDTAHTARAAEIEDKVRKFKDQRQPIQTSLEGNILLARNLAILTPFQKITRDRVASTLPSLGAKIRADRLQLAKLDLWVSVLENDLEREKREFARVRHVALQAAAKSLRDPLGVQGVVHQVNKGVEVAVPKLALPDGVGEGDVAAFGTSPGELPVIFRRPSEEFGRPGISRQTSGVSTKSGDGDLVRPKLARQVSDSSGSRVRPVLQRSSSDYLKARVENGGESQSSTPPMMFALSDVAEREEGKKGGEVGKGEEPEDWQNTRAARRVSLANIPADVVGKLKMSTWG